MTKIINLLDFIIQIHLEKKTTIWHDFPFDADKKSTVVTFYQGLYKQVKRRTKALCYVEPDSYGSGYASFYDAWFYKKTPDFDNKFAADIESYEGLVVLVHKHLPYYVFMQGTKSWKAADPASRSSYLPSRKLVDNLTNSAVIELASEVEKILSAKGLVRLKQKTLDTRLDIQIDIPTELMDGYLSYFDGLFYWED